jgi:hypothetical protein
MLTWKGTNASLLRCLESSQSSLALLSECEFSQCLQNLASVVKAQTSNIGSQRTLFSRMTACFKRYWVPKGESLQGFHIALARKYLRADQEAVTREIVHRQDVLRDHLSDKPTEDFGKLSSVCLSLASSEDPRCWLLCICMSVGCRKGEALGYSRFETVDQVKFIGDADGTNLPIRDPELFESLIGSDMCIRQESLLKDPAQRINRYLSPEDPRHVAPRSIVKPCLFLHPMDVLFLISKLRSLDMSPEESRRFGTKRKTFNSLFNSGPHCSERSWSLGTHYGRKLYANASYHAYAPKLQRINGALMDRNAWIELVLGHTGSLLTSLSYSTVALENVESVSFKKSRIF